MSKQKIVKVAVRRGGRRPKYCKTNDYRHPDSIPVEFEGITYASQSDLARKLGCTPCLITYHFNKHGNYDTLGSVLRKEPIVVFDKEYTNLSEVARAFNRNDNVVRRHYKRGDLEEWLSKPQRKWEKKPVTYKGKQYSTQKELAQATGKDIKTVNRLYHAGEIDKLETGYPNSPVSFVAEGEEWRSYTQYARRLGCTPATVKRWHLRGAIEELSDKIYRRNLSKIYG